MEEWNHKSWWLKLDNSIKDRVCYIFLASKSFARQASGHFSYEKAVEGKSSGWI